MANLPEQAHRPWPMFLGWLLVGALWMAVFADMGTSLAVIGNGLRLQR